MDYWHSLLSYRCKIFVACWEIECQFSSQRAILVYDKQGIQNTVVSNGKAAKVLLQGLSVHAVSSTTVWLHLNPPCMKKPACRSRRSLRHSRKNGLGCGKPIAKAWLTSTWMHWTHTRSSSMVSLNTRSTRRNATSSHTAMRWCRRQYLSSSVAREMTEYSFRRRDWWNSVRTTTSSRCQSRRYAA